MCFTSKYIILLEKIADYLPRLCDIQQVRCDIRPRQLNHQFKVISMKKKLIDESNNKAQETPQHKLNTNHVDKAQETPQHYLKIVLASTVIITNDDSNKT